jgi:hypothetical protein
MAILEVDQFARVRCANEIVNSHNDRQLAQILTWAEPTMRDLIIARLAQLRRVLDPNAV